MLWDCLEAMDGHLKCGFVIFAKVYMSAKPVDACLAP